MRALERDYNYRGANEASRNAFREFSGFVDEVVLMGKRFDGGRDGNAAAASLDEQSLANRLAKLIRRRRRAGRWAVSRRKGPGSLQRSGVVFSVDLDRSNKTNKCR